MNFTFKGLQDSALAVHQLRTFAARLEEQAGGEAAEVDLTHPVLERFAEALADDLNISGAIAIVFEWMKKPKGKAKTNLGVMRKIDSVLGVLKTPALGEADVLARGELGEQALAEKLEAINAARKAKEFDTADAVKQALRDLNYDVMDTPLGTVAVARPVVI